MHDNDVKYPIESSFWRVHFLVIIKWFSILVIFASIALLILSFSAGVGFSFQTWNTFSQSSIIGSNSSSTGPGILQERLLQLLISFFGGGALAIAGTLLQKVTKNRLAEISILGIGSINILFIFIYVSILGPKAFSGGVAEIMMPIILIVVSVLGTMCVWAISRSPKANKNTFVIIGIAIQLLVEAASVVVVNPTKMINSGARGKKIWKLIQGYTLGNVRNNLAAPETNPVHWWLLFLGIGIIIGVILVAWFIRRKIDTYELSEELAVSTGINIKALRFIMYILIALLAGAAAVIIGTIALLGILAPSIARLLFKNRFAPVAIASFLIGGSMVAFASFLSFNLEWGMPIGILSTAIICPYFVFLIMRRN